MSTTRHNTRKRNFRRPNKSRRIVVDGQAFFWRIQPSASIIEIWDMSGQRHVRKVILREAVDLSWVFELDHIDVDVTDMWLEKDYAIKPRDVAQMIRGGILKQADPASQVPCMPKGKAKARAAKRLERQDRQKFLRKQPRVVQRHIERPNLPSMTLDPLRPDVFVVMAERGIVDEKWQKVVYEGRWDIPSYKAMRQQLMA